MKRFLLFLLVPLALLIVLAVMINGALCALFCDWEEEFDEDRY